MKLLRVFVRGYWSQYYGSKNFLFMFFCKLSYFFQKYIEMYCGMFGYCWKATGLSGCDGKNEKI